MFLKGELSNRPVNKYRSLIPGNGMRYSLMPIFYKAGSYSQGLYVSPKDLVSAWFGTIIYDDLTHYARAIARPSPCWDGPCSDATKERVPATTRLQLLRKSASARPDCPQG
jgi:hypothetical protein